MNLDREIEELLAVDHSPELPAKIRARVAVEPPPAASWFSWGLMPVVIGSAAVAVLATVWLSSSVATSDTPRLAPAVGAAAAAADVGRLKAAPTDAGRLKAAPTPASETRQPLAPAPTPVAATGAEILISPDDARAFRLLLATAREGMVLELQPVAADDAVVGPPWIEIAPVVIQPLAQLAQDEGGRQ